MVRNGILAKNELPEQACVTLWYAQRREQRENDHFHAV